MGTKRFRAGKGYGGALAVIDGSRGNRAVLIVLPDPKVPTAQGRVLDLVVECLNAEHERMQARQAGRVGK
ncbi:MAG: hypothetical protein ACOZEN_09010 [Thermodesulfobacteriota bacterium]